MKIVYVLENYEPHIGGVEIVFKQLAEHFASDSQNEVHVITHRLPGTPKEEVKEGVKIHRISVPPFLSRYFFTFLAIPTALKVTKGADIIHTTTYNSCLMEWEAVSP